MDLEFYSKNYSFFNFNLNDNFRLVRNDRMANTINATKVNGAKNAMNNGTEGRDELSAVRRMTKTM
jgi:hypothetical protein